MTHRSKNRSSSDTVTIGTESWEALWQKVAEPPKLREVDAAREGWLGTLAIAARWGVHRRTAAEKLRQGVKDGRFEVREAILSTGRSGLIFRPKISGTVKPSRRGAALV